jgi:sRNA-binding carbon storage regulator CsrA
LIGIFWALPILKKKPNLRLILCSSALALTNDSDQVVLFNGDHITGHLLSTSDETVSILTEAAGTINIHRAAIKEVIAQPKEAVQGVAPKPPEQPSVLCMLNAKPVPSSWAFTLQGAPNKVVLGTQSQEQFGAGMDLRSAREARKI